MIAHVGPIPVEELVAMAIGSGTALAAGAAWVRCSAERLARRRGDAPAPPDAD